MSPRTPVVSLGAGVQSSAMLLMLAAGEFDDLEHGRPEVAIFADTQFEPPGVYEQLAALRLAVWRHGIEVATVTAGDLRADVVRFAAGEGSRYVSPPFYVQAPSGKQAMLRRQCTKDYKLTPIWRELRARGYGPTRPVEQWIGISLDEVERMAPSRKLWASTFYPLIEKRLTRHDCELWLTRNGWPIPVKSACIGCPYHDDATWRAMKRDRPDEWAQAVAWDEAIRHLPRLDSPAYVHRSLTPLAEVDLANAEDLGQLVFTDCDGMCGT